MIALSYILTELKNIEYPYSITKCSILQFVKIYIEYIVLSSNCGNWSVQTLQLRLIIG